MIPLPTVIESFFVEVETGTMSAGSVALGRAAPNDSTSAHMGAASTSTTPRSATGAGFRICVSPLATGITRTSKASMFEATSA